MGDEMKKLWDYFRVAPGNPLWNFTNMLWSEDDVYQFLTEGYLEPGQTFGVSLPFVADAQTLHICGIKGTGEGDFNLSINFLTEGFTLTARGIPDAPVLPDPCITTADQWVPLHGMCLGGRLALNGFAICSLPVYADDSGLLSVIDGGSGNLGVVTQVQWSITNTSPARAYYKFKGEITRGFPEKVAEYSTIPAGFVFPYPNWIVTGDALTGDIPRICYAPDYTQVPSPPPVYTLDIETYPLEAGSTTPLPGKHSYNSGQMVVINAIPYPGWQFDGWLGNVTNPALVTTTVVMDADQKATATFSPVTKTMTVSGFSVTPYPKRRISTSTVVVDSYSRAPVSGVAVNVVGTKANSPASGKVISLSGTTDAGGRCDIFCQPALQKGDWTFQPVSLSKAGYKSVIPGGMVKTVHIS